MLISNVLVNDCQPSMWDIPSLLNFILGYEDMGAKHGRETLILNAKKHCQGKVLVEMPTHTHNRFTALWNLSGTTRVSRYQNRKRVRSVEM